MNGRLNEIKENVTVIANHAVCITKTDYDWLIEQAEKNEKLKEKIEDLHCELREAYEAYEREVEN